MARKWVPPTPFHPGADRAAPDFAFVLVGGRRIRSLSQAGQTRAAHHSLACERSRQVDGGSSVKNQQAAYRKPVKINHNSSWDDFKLTTKRIENLEKKKEALGGKIREIFAEAKSRGQDVKRIRLIVELKKWIEVQNSESDARRKERAAHSRTVSRSPEARA
jgi:uncharacterized protein (UPF0335 family)